MGEQLTKDKALYFTLASKLLAAWCKYIEKQ